MQQPQVSYIVSDTDTRAGERGWAFLAITWGGWVALPWMNTFDSAPSYANMSALVGGAAQEWIWGAAICLLGLTELWLVQHGSLLRRQYVWIVAGFTALVMGYEFLLSNPRSAFMPVFFVYGLYCFYFSRRVRQLHTRSAKLRERGQSADAL